MTALDLVLNLANKQLNEPVFPGNNGPHNHTETPVRNTAHWIITFLNLFKWTKNEAYRSKALELADIFFNPVYRPKKKTFLMREHPGKDGCNGLIGQAWVLEAFIELFNATEEDRFLLTALELAELHPFNTKAGLWYSVEVDGSVLEIDPTFNHQLWFAFSIGGLKNHSSTIAKKVKIFLDRLDVNLTQVGDMGVILHPIDRNLRSPETYYPLLLRRKINQILSGIRNDRILKRDATWQEASIGYHIFNMFAFSLLRIYFPSHRFWSGRRFRSIVRTLTNPLFIQELDGNKFAYPYNAPGYEAPVVFHYLSDLYSANTEEMATKLLMKQIKFTYDASSGFFLRNTTDALTLTARIYEITRLPVEILQRYQIND